MKLLSGLLLAAFLQTTQTPGTATFTPITPVTTQQPASLALAAGTVNCSVIGNTAPATGLIVSCYPGQPNGFLLPVIGLAAGQSMTLDVRNAGDAVTMIFSAGTSGAITCQAAATPNGGTATMSTGTF